MKSLPFLPKPKKPRVFIRRVQGKSMSPTLKPGQVVIGWNVGSLQKGDIIMFEHDGLEKIKRVKAIRGRALFVCGDNVAASTDSRHFGWLEARLVIGRVFWPVTKR